MLPVDFEQANATLGPPDDMSNCTGLRVHKGYDIDGLPAIVSKWRLSKEDLEEINTTGELWLIIYGHGQPPVCLTTESPFNI